MLLGIIVFVLLFFGSTKLLESRGHSFYPYYTLHNYVERAYIQVVVSMRRHDQGAAQPPTVPVPQQKAVEESTKVIHRPEISNHPGDLRFPINYLLYGGAILWIVAVVGAVCILLWRPICRRVGTETEKLSYWGLLVGVWYIAVTAYHVQTAPDARFFLPGLPFILLPMTQAVSALPWRRVWLPLILTASLIQSAPVLAKTWTLRHVPSGVSAAIDYLRTNPPSPNCVFMYPEGNYRLFPCGHNWYLNYALKEFWKADNDQRLKMLHDFKLGAIVIKKYRVGKIDAEMNDLGVYPDYFVRDIAGDKRFIRVLDNRDVAIYLVPPIQSPSDERH